MNEGMKERSALEDLRRVDYDRFLCVIASPTHLQADLTSLYLFNAELASIIEKVSEQTLGLIRLQWWRDALNEIAHDQSHRHHLVQALADMLRRGKLDIKLLRCLIDVRERDVEATTPTDLTELEGYASDSAGVLAELALTVCSTATSEHERLAARQAGTAYGLVGIVRATSYFARQHRVMLPGIDRDRLIAQQPDQQLVKVVEKICARARILLTAARKAQLPRTAIPALFPGRLVATHLERLRRYRYDPFAAGALAPSGLDIWRLVFARWSGRI